MSDSIPPFRATAIVVAGGSGVRMKGPVRKQYLLLNGRPILARTLSVFLQCETVDRVYLAVPPTDFDHVRENILSLCPDDARIELVPGGKERQHSVRNGLRAMDSDKGADAEYVVVHDGVRPLISPGDIERCVDGARATGACIVGVAAKETLKQVDADGFVERTLDRETVRFAQTPQAFRRDLLRTAHERAESEGFLGTDDAALVERLGVRVRVIDGSPFNIKITTPEDLALAEAVLKIQETG